MKYVRNEISPSDVERQRGFLEKIRGLDASNGLTAPLALVDTFGCQQNEADSEKIRGMLRDAGYGFTDDPASADVIVINTCAVREHAEKRILGNVGALTHAKAAHPGQVIALCGCMVQQPVMADKIRNSYRIVDLVFGPHSLWRFPELLYRVKNRHTRVFAVEDEAGSVCEGLPVMREEGVKSWLSVMYGCNNFCSYCIVPYVRGRERSRTPEAVFEEARELIASGSKDITLLGQNVNSYGKDLGTGVDFADLIRGINDMDGEFLIRFMTSHPKDAGDRLFAALRDCEKAAHHLHLPFQAGSSRILRAMNRGYTADEYLRLVDKARSYVPDIVLTSDVIVGFPGETGEDFEQTMKIIETVGFDALFTFIYSPRPGTPAASMPDPATKEEKQERFDRLLVLQNSISEKKHASYVGSVQRVLVDGFSSDGKSLLTARTNGGRLVHLDGDASLIGKFTDVKITQSNTWALFGEAL